MGSHRQDCKAEGIGAWDPGCGLISSYIPKYQLIPLIGKANSNYL